MKTTALRALWVGAMVGCALGALRAAEGAAGAEPPHGGGPGMETGYPGAAEGAAGAEPPHGGGPGMETGYPGAAEGAAETELPPPDFRAPIFWAYGLACGALAALSVWTAVGLARIRKRTDELARRLDRDRGRG